MALTLGRPSVASAALLFFAVAPPRVAMDALPGLHTWLGPQALVESPDGGLPLAMWLAGLAAHAGVRRGEGTPAVAARALRRPRRGRSGWPRGWRGR
jgi:hypothetical protein